MNAYQPTLSSGVDIQSNRPMTRMVRQQQENNDEEDWGQDAGAELLPD